MKARLSAVVATRHRDLLIATALGLIMAAWSLSRSAMLPDSLYHYGRDPLPMTDVVWFDADIPRNACVMTDRHVTHHFATSRHPLISTLQYVPVQVAIRGLRRAPIDAIRLVVAAQAGLWLAVFFMVLRQFGLRRGDATVFAILAAMTAAAVFWTAVPESFVLGSIALLLPAFIAGVVPRLRAMGLELLVHVVALGTSVTNWASALLATLLVRRPAAALQVAANVIVIVAALGAVQRLWFPSATVFPGSGQAYYDGPALGLLDVRDTIVVFVLHAIVMPAQVVKLSESSFPVLSVQAVPLLSHSWLGACAAVFWAVLLGMGARELWRGGLPGSLRGWLIALVGVQFALHLVIGWEAFLYAMHFAPLLVLIAALATRSPHRRAVLILAVVAVLVLGASNLRQFEAAVAVTWQLTGQAVALGATFGPGFACR